MEKIILRMVKAASHARLMDEGLLKEGYSTNPYGYIFGEIADAIFYLLGESVNRFEDSMTYIALHSDAITDEAKAELLHIVYKQNRPALS